MPATQTPQVQMHRGRMLLYAAQQHANEVNEPPGQLGENGFDAGARRLRIHLTPTKIAFIDDGHGLVRYISPTDRPKIAKYITEDPRSRGDLRDRLSRISLFSLEWMMEHVALSAKRPGADADVSGMMGLGFWSWLVLGKKVRIVTRPSKDLLNQYHEDFETHPTWEIFPPTHDALAVEDLSYDGRLVTADALYSPLRETFQHGTRIEITDLHPRLFNYLLPATLATDLGSRLAGRLGPGREVVIIDEVTKEGQNTPGGRIIHVHRPVIKGEVIYDGMVKTGDGNQFYVFLYHDPTATGLYPKVQFHQDAKSPLHFLSGFDHEPWTSGQLGGTVAFPMYSHEDILWESTKQRPLPRTQEYERWLEACKGLEAKLLEKMKVKPSDTTALLQKLSAWLSDTTKDILANHPLFQKVQRSQQPLRNTKGAKKTTRGSKTLPEEVNARVINEHREGVKGIIVELRQHDKLIEAKPSDEYGWVRFGKRPMGLEYSLKLIVPPPDPNRLLPPIEAEGNIEVIFALIANAQPGVTITFNLVTHEPQRVIRTVSGFQAVYQSLGKEGPLWKGLLKNGIIIFNIEHPALKVALEEGNDLRAAQLCAKYAASAISEYALQGPSGFILLKRDELELSFEEALTAAVAADKRSRKRSSKLTGTKK